MKDQEKNDWNRWAKYVLKTLEENEKKIGFIRDTVQTNYTSFCKIKTHCEDCENRIKRLEKLVNHHTDDLQASELVLEGMRIKSQLRTGFIGFCVGSIPSIVLLILKIIDYLRGLN